MQRFYPVVALGSIVEYPADLAEFGIPTASIPEFCPDDGQTGSYAGLEAGFWEVERCNRSGPILDDYGSTALVKEILS